jgi:hypothetical protein
MSDKDKEEGPTFWQNAWMWLKKLSRWVYAPLVAIVIIAVVFILVALGCKDSDRCPYRGARPL